MEPVRIDTHAMQRRMGDCEMAKIPDSASQIFIARQSALEIFPENFGHTVWLAMSLTDPLETLWLYTSKFACTGF